MKTKIFKVETKILPIATIKEKALNLTVFDSRPCSTIPYSAEKMIPC